MKCQCLSMPEKHWRLGYGLVTLIAQCYEQSPAMSQDTRSSRLPGYSKLTAKERLDVLVAKGFIQPEDKLLLQKSVDKRIINAAEDFIENVIGCYPLPLGLATNFIIDGQERVIPLAVEETSIIAALCKTAKWVREHGEIHTEMRGNTVIGQIQIGHVQDAAQLAAEFAQHKQRLIALANQDAAASLQRRGGGVEDMVLRWVPRQDSGQMAVIHVHMNACDAMGANVINQVCEQLKPEIEAISGETVSMCIVSNLVDSKLAIAEVRLRGVEPSLAAALVEASHFAEQDPYRAATSNKGVLNGIDPLLIATGNDWRAVEAGIHAYAARSGQYRSITQWRLDGDVLVGRFEAPLCVGTVGGVTRLHPTANACLRMLDITKADDLARVAAAVGLVQNLAAIRALVTDGIVQGHMRLHISNLIMSAGAQHDEVNPLRKQLEALLAYTQKITLSDALAALQKLRQQNAATHAQASSS